MLEVFHWRRPLSLTRLIPPGSLALGLIAALPLGAAAAESASADHNPYRYLDWLPRSQLSPAVLQTIPATCGGAFVSPPSHYPDAQLAPNLAPLRATADSSEWQDDGSAQLRGQVHITQGYRQLSATEALHRQDTISLSGAIELREPNLLVRGNNAKILTDKDTAEVEDATYVIHDEYIHGSARRVVRTGDGELIVTAGNYTRCEPGHEFWRLSGSEITIDNKAHQGTARNVQLKVLDVPVFYFPYFRFPVGDERLSGLLFPTISNSDTNGVDIAIPYYWNIAPQLDATIVPRYIQYRGTALELETRHLSHWAGSELRLAGLPDDRGGNDSDARDLIDNGFPESLVLPGKGENRWLVNFEQRASTGSFWYSNIDYTKVSDADYFRDINTANLNVAAETSLSQMAEAGIHSHHWRASLRVQEYQQLVKDQFDTYSQLPRLNVDGGYRWGDWQLRLEHEATRWQHRDTQSILVIGDVSRPDSIEKLTRNFVNADRRRVDYRFSWNKQWLWGYLAPQLAARYVGYTLDDTFLKTTATTTPEASAAQFSIDSGLFFERTGALWGRNFIQTLEPRLFVLTSTDANQEDFYNVTGNRENGGNDLLFDTSLSTFSYDQLFRDSRFTGKDRIDDTDRAALGLTTRIIDPGSGRDLLIASAGQIHYLQGRDEVLNNLNQSLPNPGVASRSEATPDSELAARLESHPTEFLRLSSELIYDDSEHKLNRGNIDLRYLDRDARLFNLGYRYLRQREERIDGALIRGSIDQINASMVLPVTASTAILASANYDLTFKRELEYLAGIEYESCCYSTRLVWRRSLQNNLADLVNPQDLEFDQGLYFEIQLKGLAGIGNSLTRTLSQGIANFNQRELLKQ